MYNWLEQEVADVQAKLAQLLLWCAVPFEFPAAGNSVTVKIRVSKNARTRVSNSAFVSWEISDIKLPV